MLAPNLKYASNCITDVYNNVLNSDKLSLVGSSASVRKIIEEPEWLSILRTRLEKLKITSDEWTSERPEVLEKVMTPFLNYSNSFQAISENINNLNKNEMAALFSELRENAKKAKNDSIRESQKFKGWLSDLKAEIKLIDESIEDGWSEIGQEEANAIELVKSISALETELTSLEDSITPSILSSQADFYKSVISITFEIALDTATVPYLSFLGLFITEGKMFIDLYKNTKNIEILMNQICSQQISLSHTSQALAESKAVIRFLYDLCKSALQIDYVFDDITNIWSEQIDDLNGVISLLNNGVAPEDIMDIQVIEAASEIWQKLKAIAYKVTMGPDVGTSFEINVGSNN